MDPDNMIVISDSDTEGDGRGGHCKVRPFISMLPEVHVVNTTNKTAPIIKAFNSASTNVYSIKTGDADQQSHITSPQDCAPVRKISVKSFAKEVHIPKANPLVKAVFAKNMPVSPTTNTFANPTTNTQCKMIKLTNSKLKELKHSLVTHLHNPNNQAEGVPPKIVKLDKEYIKSVEARRPCGPTAIKNKGPIKLVDIDSILQKGTLQPQSSKQEDALIVQKAAGFTIPIQACRKVSETQKLNNVPNSQSIAKLVLPNQTNASATSHCIITRQSDLVQHGIPESIATILKALPGLNKSRDIYLIQIENPVSSQQPSASQPVYVQNHLNISPQILEINGSNNLTTAANSSSSTSTINRNHATSINNTYNVTIAVNKSNKAPSTNNSHNAIATVGSNCATLTKSNDTIASDNSNYEIVTKSNRAIPNNSNNAIATVVSNRAIPNNSKNAIAIVVSNHAIPNNSNSASATVVSNHAIPNNSNNAISTVVSNRAIPNNSNNAIATVVGNHAIPNNAIATVVSNRAIPNNAIATVVSDCATSTNDSNNGHCMLGGDTAGICKEKPKKLVVAHRCLELRKTGFKIDIEGFTFFDRLGFFKAERVRAKRCANILNIHIKCRTQELEKLLLKRAKFEEQQGLYRSRMEKLVEKCQAQQVESPNREQETIKDVRCTKTAKTAELKKKRSGVKNKRGRKAIRDIRKITNGKVIKKKYGTMEPQQHMKNITPKPMRNYSEYNLKNLKIVLSRKEVERYLEQQKFPCIAIPKQRIKLPYKTHHYIELLISVANTPTTFVDKNYFETIEQLNSSENNLYYVSQHNITTALYMDYFPSFKKSIQSDEIKVVDKCVFNKFMSVSNAHKNASIKMFCNANENECGKVQSVSKQAEFCTFINNFHVKQKTVQHGLNLIRLEHNYVKNKV